eukprot:3926738-Prymnesium_polylepis.1
MRSSSRLSTAAGWSATATAPRAAHLTRATVGPFIAAALDARLPAAPRAQANCDAIYYTKAQQPVHCRHIVSPLMDSTGTSASYFVHVLEPFRAAVGGAAAGAATNGVRRNNGLPMLGSGAAAGAELHGHHGHGADSELPPQVEPPSKGGVGASGAPRDSAAANGAHDADREVRGASDDDQERARG